MMHNKKITFQLYLLDSKAPAVQNNIWTIEILTPLFLSKRCSQERAAPQRTTAPCWPSPCSTVKTAFSTPPALEIPSTSSRQAKIKQNSILSQRSFEIWLFSMWSECEVQYKTHINQCIKCVTGIVNSDRSLDCNVGLYDLGKNRTAIYKNCDLKCDF